MNNENPRLRRAKKTRSKLAELHATRLTIYRSNGNIYAQIIESYIIKNYKKKNG